MRTLSQADSSGNPPLVAIVGPTAAGKTSLSIRLCVATGGEIVSADSRQLYRGMDIGTAKASADDQARVPHHLLDVVDPDETPSLALYQQLAFATIDRIHSRGCVPFLVGGTGQYVMAVIEGWQVPQVPPDERLRRQLYEQADVEGADGLHQRLRELDPAAAAKIDARNVRRVVRALEVCLTTGRPISSQQRKVPPPYRILMLGLALSREELYHRIDARVERMLAEGLESEVRTLLSAGYGFDLPSMSGIGYGEFAAYLAGEATIDDVSGAIKRHTRRFVRQQSNWFRESDPRIHWLDGSPDPFPKALATVSSFLRR